MKLTVFVSPRRVFLVLTVVVICLSIVSLAGQFSRYILGHGRLFGLIRLFNVGQDSNVPTWYSSITLLFCSLLLAFIATSQKTARTRYALHWKVLSAIFLYISIDEVAMIHENADVILGSSISRTGFLNYGWVAVGIPLTLVFVLSYLKFLAHLPKKTRLLFVVAGTIFISGALGAEMFAARHDNLYGLDMTYAAGTIFISGALGAEMFAGNHRDLYGFDMIYAMITALEEFCEMFGIVVFIYALLSYINENLKEVNFGIPELIHTK